jgi:hypothetical protein
VGWWAVANQLVMPPHASYIMTKDASGTSGSHILLDADASLLPATYPYVALHAQ